MGTTFRKPATSIEEQIKLLQKRGLIINDVTRAEHCLNHIGYYRLAGYWQVFQDDRVNHTFIAGTTLESILELYHFDRELRILLLDAIECIEVSLRSVIVNEMCAKYSSDWYAWDAYAYSKDVLTDILKNVEVEIERADEDFIKHHRRKYGYESYPPAWKTMQVLSIGTLSKLYGNIDKSLPEKKVIARIYGLPSEDWLHSWLQSLSVLRNYCAHHSRICYRVFSFPPKTMYRNKYPWISRASMPEPGGLLSQLAYSQLCAAKYLLHTSSPGNEFGQKMKQLFGEYLSVEPGKMGFSPDWANEPLWQ